MNRKHWNSYIERQNPAFRSRPLPPEFAADMVVVIPCYNEPGLFDTLHSLLVCARPKGKVCTVIVFNAGERSSAEGIVQNRISKTFFSSFQRFQDHQISQRCASGSFPARKDNVGD